MGDFDGKSVIVTGATSGIGKAIARAFAHEGASLLITGRDHARGQAIADEMLNDTATDNILFMAGDVGDPVFCQSLVETAVARFGGLHVLLNNAGVIHRATAEATTDAQWRETMSVNVDAVFYLSRAAVPALRKCRGNIVNIASDWGLYGGPKAAAYCASKGAVVQLTRAMALDHAADGIRINAVCPGDIDTPMIDRECMSLGLDIDEGKAQFGSATPLGRIGQPQEVADAVIYMASDKASFMTGTAFTVDGGASG